MRIAKKELGFMEIFLFYLIIALFEGGNTNIKRNVDSTLKF